MSDKERPNLHNTTDNYGDVQRETNVSIYTPKTLLTWVIHVIGRHKSPLLPTIVQGGYQSFLIEHPIRPSRRKKRVKYLVRRQL